ncbi:MFS transporter [Amycolatopsis sp. NPDC051128]|uniref:MFS transporter n=1 Tax=Amycolatopsis sp. NPDC051128 TaxID=3155412 RepID=UPI003427BE18
MLAVIVVPIGLVTQVFNTTANSHLQLTAGPELRGRVMSLYALVFIGGLPVGGPVMGWITDRVGPRGGVFIAGAIAVVAAAIVWRCLTTADRRQSRSRAAAKSSVVGD